MRLKAVIVFILLGLRASAQLPDPCLQRDVLIGVMDDRGRPMSKLSASHFRAELRGQPLVINSIRLGPLQRRVVLVLDKSGSMVSAIHSRKWRITTEAARAIVAATPEQWPVALITVGEQLEVIQGFNGARAVLAKTLGGYAADAKLPKGRTALIDGISKAMELLTPPQLGDTIYVVTDGGENTSSMSLGKLQRALVEARVRLVVILVVDNQPKTEEERVGPGEFADLAVQTGGWNLFATDVEDQKGIAAITNTIEALSSDPGLVLQLQSPQPIDKWRSWRLDVVDDKGHKRKHFVISYPKKLGPCH